MSTLNLLSTLTINKMVFQFGTNPESDKFSLLIGIPAWKVELTEGKGKQKKVTAIVDASFSKRAVNDVVPFLDPRIPEDLLQDACDKALPGFRSFCRKNDLSATISDKPTCIQAEKNEAGEITGFKDVASVKEVISILLKECDRLTPKAGSVADPQLEAKRVFSKSAEYANLDYTNHANVFQAWEKEQLDNIKRVLDKAKELTAEDFKAFCVTKNADNGCDEDGFVRLKAKSEK